MSSVCERIESALGCNSIKRIVDSQNTEIFNALDISY